MYNIVRSVLTVASEKTHTDTHIRIWGVCVYVSREAMLFTHYTLCFIKQGNRNKDKL